ncbi:ABC transporter permease [Pseudonocardia sp. HH130630-07]|uniref:ABC transporter permease n=1 Tax=Pseudonocardia sp. HH130630-07 TaxID=1690815 RepID=UPI001E2E5B4E|nr:ABC transporter permease [Pseudonocardia sp. HH130630-07]
MFVLVRLAPGDPAAAYAGPTASPEDLDRIRAQLGLDEPLLTQYLTFLGNLLRGDLGTSYSFAAPALDVVLGRVPYTITLAVSAVVVTTLVAVPLGIWMARRADTGRELGATCSPSPGSRCPTSGAASCCSPCSRCWSRCCPPRASRRGPGWCCRR